VRGKKKASKRFEAFRKSMISHFKTNEDAIMSDFMAFIRDGEGSFVDFLKMSCDKDENLIFDVKGPTTTLYQVLRIADRPILLREVERLFETIADESLARSSAYRAFAVLYSIGLVDYKFKDVIATPANVIQIFLKED